MTLFQRESYYFPLLPFKRSLFHTVGDFNALAGWEYEWTIGQCQADFNLQSDYIKKKQTNQRYLIHVKVSSVCKRKKSFLPKRKEKKN